MKKILVTGGTGFIGSHLSEALVKNGYSVRVFDRYNPNYNLGNLKNSKYKSKIDFVFGDIRDYDSVVKAVKNCDIIFHLAALIGIPYSYHSPSAYIKTNIEGTYNILEAAKNLKTKKIFITSTSEVYGSAKYLPIDEEHPLQPQSPYSASKISADALSIAYFNSFDLPVNILRPFNTYGPRQSQRAIIPSLIKQILKIEKKGKIFVGNVHPRREFNFVEDVCAAFLNAMKLKKYGQIINIGNGYDISIKQLINIISMIMNKKVEIKISKKRKRPQKSEVKRLSSSTRKTKKLLNWKPKYSNYKGLSLGLRKTIEWNTKSENTFAKKYVI